MSNSEESVPETGREVRLTKRPDKEKTPDFTAPETKPPGAEITGLAGTRSVNIESRGGHQSAESEDEVEEASEESFPASDAPAWIGAVVH